MQRRFAGISGIRAATYFVLSCGLLLATVALTGSPPLASTQSGTASHLDCGSPPVLPDGPADRWWSLPTLVPDEQRLHLDRLAIPPGKQLQLNASAAVIYVECGTITLVVEKGDVWLGEPESTEPWPFPTLPVGKEVELAPGDSLFHDTEASYHFTNEGEEEALLWQSRLEPPPTPDPNATPIATPASCAGARC